MEKKTRTGDRENTNHPEVIKELHEAIRKAAERGRINFLVKPEYPSLVWLLSKKGNSSEARLFVKALEYIPGADNSYCPWEMVMKPGTNLNDPQHIAEDLSEYLKEHFPEGADSPIDIYSSQEDFRSMEFSRRTAYYIPPKLT